MHRGKNGKPWSRQYTHARLAKLGVPREPDGRFDFETAEALHAGDVPHVPPVGQVGQPVGPGPILVPNDAASGKGEPAGGPTGLAGADQELGNLSRNDVEKRLSMARARKAEAELAEVEGRLLDADGARKLFSAVGRMYAQARENVPAQLAPKLVGRTDLNEIEAIVRATLREADTGVANEIHARYPEMRSDAGIAVVAG